jgi:hypothetical protein
VIYQKGRRKITPHKSGRCTVAVTATKTADPVIEESLDADSSRSMNSIFEYVFVITVGKTVDLDSHAFKFRLTCQVFKREVQKFLAFFMSIPPVDSGIRTASSLFSQIAGECPRDTKTAGDNKRRPTCSGCFILETTQPRYNTALPEGGSELSSWQDRSSSVFRRFKHVLAK